MQSARYLSITAVDKETSVLIRTLNVVVVSASVCLSIMKTTPSVVSRRSILFYTPLTHWWCGKNVGLGRQTFPVARSTFS